MSKVNPWSVEGKVDYDKLIKEFGINYLKKEHLKFLEDLASKKNMKLHYFLKRELFFSHRDFDKIIEDVKNKKEIFLYTGRAPGGSMHIGHLIPFLFTKYLQDLFDCSLYIQIPDDEKFMFKKDLDIEKIEEMTNKDLLDIAAIEFDIDKTFIFKNREFMPKMYELVIRAAKKLTFSQVRNTFGFSNENNIGTIFYPALQIAPTFFEKNKRCLIPCAIDQNPYFMLQRDISKKLGFKKNSTILSKFLCPLDGPEGKMSASNSDKAILLTDSKDVIKKKINKYAFSGGRQTIEEHRRLGANPNIDTAYNWLYYLFTQDDKEIEKIYKDYKSGKMLSSEIKNILIGKVNELIENHNKKKEKVLKENLLEKYMYSGKLAKKMWK